MRLSTSWVKRPGVREVFQFITRVFSGVEARALFKPLEFLDSILGKQCLFHTWQCHAERGLGLLVFLKKTMIVKMKAVMPQHANVFYTIVHF